MCVCATDEQLALIYKLCVFYLGIIAGVFFHSIDITKFELINFEFIVLDQKVNIHRKDFM